MEFSTKSYKQINYFLRRENCPFEGLDDIVQPKFIIEHRQNGNEKYAEACFPSKREIWSFSPTWVAQLKNDVWAEHGLNDLGMWTQPCLDQRAIEVKVGECFEIFLSSYKKARTIIQYNLQIFLHQVKRIRLPKFKESLVHFPSHARLVCTVVAYIIVNDFHIADQILIIKPIREIREIKLLHNQALDLLRFLCEEAINPYNYFEADRNFRLPLEQATSMGIHEIVEEILRVYPYAVYLENNEKQSIFQQAIVFRQEKVFNLIYQHQESRAMVLSKGDNFNNNALHLAGYVAHPEQLYRRAGAALQMQRELQWFKEVERLVLPKNKEERNNKNKTPGQVFSDEHKELVEKGEKWMKDNASSCTIVASLIATVVFAAAIQVPGGNNDNGHPIFNQQRAFIVFGIFNALALFSSIASVLLFLSILTSRYAEEDFLVTLPKRLIFGLICLFICILFTMTAFGATLYLVFGEDKGWILIPAGALACIPVTLFCALQFPLLKDMIKSTYGSGIFYNKRDRIKTLKRS